MKVLCENPHDQNVYLSEQDAADLRVDETGVLIHVAASGINRADILQKKGLYPPPEGVTHVLGLECAGEVVAVGARVTQFKPGDRVMALLSGGGYASHVLVHHTHVVPMPPHFSYEQGAAFMEAFLTAYLNIFLIGKVQKNHTVLIQGGSGGVGMAAIRLCKVYGVRCFGMSSHVSKHPSMLQQGASYVWDYKDPSWVQHVVQATQGRGVDVVLDCVAGNSLQKHVQCASLDAKIVVIGLLGGVESTFSCAMLLHKRISLIGSTLRSLSVTEKQHIVASFLNTFGTFLYNGNLNPCVYKVFDWKEVQQAHVLMLRGEHTGKLVLKNSAFFKQV
jgi:putative PIG3 family NAD(P)H quinone oxidoreductase